MLADALALLRCPLCAQALVLHDRTVRCATGHAFDVARQGYLSLLGGGGAPPGDTAAMIAARETVQGAGLFDPLAAAVAEAAGDGPGPVVELGAGTAFHLRAVLERRPDALGLALDVAKPALRRAARVHPRVAAIGCDVWVPLPLRDGVADAALCVFAPRNGPELARVLAPDGALVVATPTPDHLAQLVAPLGLLEVDARKDERLAQRLAGGFELEQRSRCAWTMALDHAAVAAIAAMGPSAFHGDAAARAQRIAALDEPLAVDGSLTVARYRRV